MKPENKAIRKVEALISAMTAEKFFDFCSVDHIAYTLDVCRDTIYEWRNKYPEFSDTIKANAVAGLAVQASIKPVVERRVHWLEEDSRGLAPWEVEWIKNHTQKNYPDPQIADKLEIPLPLLQRWRTKKGDFIEEVRKRRFGPSKSP